jgi:hypothetical protein
MEPITVPLLSSLPFHSICASTETLHDLELLPNRGEIKGTDYLTLQVLSDLPSSSSLVQVRKGS